MLRGLLLSFLILGWSGTIAVTLIQYALVFGVVGIYLLYTFYKDWKKPLPPFDQEHTHLNNSIIV